MLPKYFFFQAPKANLLVSLQHYFSSIDAAKERERQNTLQKEKKEKRENKVREHETIEEVFKNRKKEKQEFDIIKREMDKVYNQLKV